VKKGAFNDKQTGMLSHTRMRGSISQDNLESALSERRGKTILLGHLLLARELVSKEDLAATFRKIVGIGYVDVTTTHIDRSVPKLSAGYRHRECCVAAVA
jgi:hypothetical protein